MENDKVDAPREERMPAFAGMTHEPEPGRSPA
jgi:hypothetical protein